MNPTVAKVQGYRQSNATGTHADKRTKRRRTRGASKRASIKESSS